MKYSVVTLGYETLRQKSKPVDLKRLSSKPFRKLIDDMIDTMRAYEGVGIAATQIGLAERIFCVEYQSNKRYRGMPNIPVYAVINPTVTILDKTPVEMIEGCLSIPDLRGPVCRASAVRLKGWNRQGEHVDFVAEGFHARIIQHEYDHLNGKVFLDRVKSTRDLCYLEHL